MRACHQAMNREQDQRGRSCSLAVADASAWWQQQATILATAWTFRNVGVVPGPPLEHPGPLSPQQQMHAKHHQSV